MQLLLQRTLLKTSLHPPSRSVTQRHRPLPLRLPQKQNTRDFLTLRNKIITMSSATTFYDLEPLDSRNQPYNFSQLKGKVALIVNVASKCGFTPQYEGLEKLYEKYKDEGLEVLGFPCNQFGGQEPGTDGEIQNFCMVNYGVKFPVLAKIDVNGNNASPVYKWLKNEKAGLLGVKLIKWNYEKFLVSKEGKVVERYASTTKPESLASAIEKELKRDTLPKAEL